MSVTFPLGSDHYAISYSGSQWKSRVSNFTAHVMVQSYKLCFIGWYNYLDCSSSDGPFMPLIYDIQLMVQSSRLSSVWWYNHCNCAPSDGTIIKTILSLIVQLSKLSSVWWYNFPDCPPLFFATFHPVMSYGVDTSPQHNKQTNHRLCHTKKKQLTASTPIFSSSKVRTWFLLLLTVLK
jgi:hypothetical protein